MPFRRRQILKGLDVSALVGVEIGPLDKPLVRKSEGRIFYVDHCDTDTLKALWATDARIDTSVLHVDAVWGQSSLRTALLSAGLTAPGADYVVASHVVEHVPDLVTWLQEVRDVLGPNGTLRLAVPDRRYSFDYLRRTSTLAEVGDAHVRKRRVPSAGRVLDFALNMAVVDCAAAWRGQIKPQTLVRGYSVGDAFILAREAEEGKYHDVHCWVFTPLSFAVLMGELTRAGMLQWVCEWLVPTERNTLEFFVSLRPTDSAAEAEASWAAAEASLPEER